MEIGSRVRRRTAALVLTSAVSLLGGAACSSAPMGDADPATGAVLPAGPASAASSATPSPSTTTRTVAAVAGPAPLPAMARARTRKGAEAFVRHFLAEYNRAVTTPVAGLLDPLSISSCKSCVGFAEDIHELIEDQERYAVAPLRVDGVTCVACGSRQGKTWFVYAWIFSNAVEIFDRRGDVVQAMESSSDVLAFDVQWHEGTWKAARIRVVR